jgi:hypothetical protein
MSSGFLQNTATPTLSSSSYVGVALVKPTDDIPIFELPTGMVRWSHIEIVVNKTGTVSGQTFDAFISWDSDGDDIAAGPLQQTITMVRGQTTTTRFMASATFDVSPTLPDDGVKSTLYLWLKMHNDLNGATLIRARLYWHDYTKG